MMGVPTDIVLIYLIGGLILFLLFLREQLRPRANLEVCKRVMHDLYPDKKVTVLAVHPAVRLALSDLMLVGLVDKEKAPSGAFVYSLTDEGRKEMEDALEYIARENDVSIEEVKKALGLTKG